MTTKYIIRSKEGASLCDKCFSKIEDALDYTEEKISQYTAKCRKTRNKYWIKLWSNCKFQEININFEEYFEGVGLVYLQETTKSNPYRMSNIANTLKSSMVSLKVNNQIQRAANKRA